MKISERQKNGIFKKRINGKHIEIIIPRLEKMVLWNRNGKNARFKYLTEKRKPLVLRNKEEPLL